MDSTLNKIFIDAIVKLAKKDIKGFAKEINNLNTILTCNCFLNGEVFTGMAKFIKEFKDDPFDYDLNLSKGFIFYFNHKEVDSFKYLSNAIEIDKSRDLPYSLRSLIASGINSNRIEDARIATSINPSARNFFLLANNLHASSEKKIQNEAITYYDKAINIEYDFACAHNNKGNLYLEMKEYHNAIKEYKDCIRIDPNHWAYKAICEAYSIIGKYNEVLKYAILGQKYHPKDFYYYLKIGESYYYLKNYIKAIDNLKIYLKYEAMEYFNSNLKYGPGNLSAKKLLSTSRIIVKNIALQRAITKYKESDFTSVSEWLNIYIDESYGVLSNRNIEEWEKIFIGLLRIKNPRINIDVENSIYIKFDKLKTSYQEKHDLNIILCKEEEDVNKMMVYREDNIIGFGKFNGKEISSIIEDEPGYLLWCVINLIHFTLPHELFLDPRIISEPVFLSALEINIIKHKLIIKCLPQIEDDYIDEEVIPEYRVRDTYGQYSGFWAQNVEGLSDNFIDDALGGEPNAYWNID